MYEVLHSSYTQLQLISSAMVTKVKRPLAILRCMSASSQVSVSMFHISPSLLLFPLPSRPPNITGFPPYNSMEAKALGYLSDATSRADPVLVSKIIVLPVVIEP